MKMTTQENACLHFYVERTWHPTIYVIPSFAWLLPFNHNSQLAHTSPFLLAMHYCDTIHVQGPILNNYLCDPSLIVIIFCFIFPPASAVEGIKSVPSVRLCVCLSFSSLTPEPFDVRTQNLVEGLTLTISQMSSMVKVIGQRSRSPGQKTWFLELQIS